MSFVINFNESVISIVYSSIILYFSSLLLMIKVLFTSNFWKILNCSLTKSESQIIVVNMSSLM